MECPKAHALLSAISWVLGGCGGRNTDLRVREQGVLLSLQYRLLGHKLVCVLGMESEVSCLESGKL